MMVLAACEYGLDGNFQKLVNPTGRFVLGGSYADCGVTGRKLACDTYGGIGRMGGGALSGKDPTKVDRSAAYMARKIAKDIVQAGYADKCEVQLAYAIGVVQPVGVAVECFGTEQGQLRPDPAGYHPASESAGCGLQQGQCLRSLRQAQPSVGGMTHAPQTQGAVPTPRLPGAG